MFETCQAAPAAGLFRYAASNRLVWRKNPSLLGTLPIFKQGMGRPLGECALRFQGAAIAEGKKHQAQAAPPAPSGGACERPL